MVLLVLSTLLISFTQSDNYFKIAKSIELFTSVYKEVNTLYVDELNPTEIMKKGIHAMLKDLDPYTVYIPEERIEDYRTLQTGEYAGIGALVGKYNDISTVLMPYDQFPAKKAGIKIGDRIISIDGKPTKGKGIGEVTQYLRGQANTSVRLRIQRYGVKDTLSIEVPRAKITIKNVPYYGMVTEDIGLIELTDFTTDASQEVREALRDLKADGAEKIILDLRNNPGGLLGEAIRISNLFIDKGLKVVSMKGRVQQWNEEHFTREEPEDRDIPLVVLINENSASASEIVSGVVQDYDRGVVVGRRSFGKGLVQVTKPLVYNAQLKVTVAKYYIPSGRCIQELNYAKKDAQGKAQKYEDSLRIAYKTKNQRTVYDGRGIKPDTTVENKDHPKIIYALADSFLIFNYATRYYYQNPDKVIDSKNFKLTDEEYSDFVLWVKEQNFTYETETQQAISKLYDVSKKEKMDKYLSILLDSLKQKSTYQKENDFWAFRDIIQEALEWEIAVHYEYEKGKVEASFDDNRDILTAVSILNNPKLYNKILNTQL